MGSCRWDALWSRMSATHSGTPSRPGAYSPRSWQSPPEVPRDEFPESWALSERILVLPCDQRYSPEHMEIVARAALRRDSSPDSL